MKRLLGAVLTSAVAPGLSPARAPLKGGANVKSVPHRLLPVLAALALVVACVPAMAAPPAGFPATIAKTQYRNWDVYKLSNGMVSLYIAPQLGGRAIQLQLADQEYFFVNKSLEGKVLPESQNNLKSGWANYGGDKAWPGPEGYTNDDEWASIPYYILDGSTWKTQVVTNTPEEVAIKLTSPEDPRTGVQLVRTFHVYRGTTRVKVDQMMRNISRRQIRWGIWHLIQNDGADSGDPSKPNPDLYMYIPLNPHSRYPDGYYKPYGDARHPSYNVIDDGKILRVHYLYKVCKAAADSSAGWFAVINGQKNTALVENFKYYPEKEYPDGASIETWNDGPGTISRGPFDQILPDDPAQTPYFLESEGMSPYAQLDPGEEFSYPIYWSVARVTNPLAGPPSWGGVASEALSAKLNGATVTLQGTFGVFTPGTLQADFYSAVGEELSHVKLLDVDPREVVRLDKTVDCPPNAYRVSLSARDSDGQNRGYLGNVILRPRQF